MKEEQIIDRINKGEAIVIIAGGFKYRKWQKLLKDTTSISTANSYLLRATIYGRFNELKLGKIIKALIIELNTAFEDICDICNLKADLFLIDERGIDLAHFRERLFLIESFSSKILILRDG